MRKPPKSYKNRRRPSLLDAMRAEFIGAKREGKEMTFSEAMDSLKRKGYFTARPRPWQIGFHDRHHGHGDYGILDRFGDLIVGPLARADVELIVAAVNAYKE